MSKRSRRQRWRTRLIDVLSPEDRRRLVVARANLVAQGDRQDMVVVSGQVPIPAPAPQAHVASPLGRALLVSGTYRPPSAAFLRRDGCPRPLSPDCSRLTVTGRWAAACFLPSYVRSRKIHGKDHGAVVRGIMHAESLACRPQAIGPSPASLELARRIQLATSVLMRSEGIDVTMPTLPPYPRPPTADRIRQRWMRALVTGWI